MAARLKAKITVDLTAPRVIDEALIRAGVEDLPEHAADDARNTCDLRDVVTVALSYQSIARIENLVGLDSLTTLQLDNNRLTRIENLSHLSSLTRLDLSFNAIAKIEGLDGLVNLTDLSLLHNKITALENMDTLTRLTVLNVAHNGIATTDMGNPVYADADTRLFVLALFSNLRYLDYKLVSAPEVADARDRKNDILRTVEEEDAEVARLEQLKVEKGKRDVLLAEAGLAGVDDQYAVGFERDPEMKKLRVCPNALGPVDQGLEQYKEAVELFVQAMLARHEERAAEKRSFQDAVNEIKRQNEEASRALLEQFEKRIRSLVREATQRQFPADLEKSVLALYESCESLQDELLDLEIEVSGQIEELIKLLQSSLIVITANNNDSITQFCLKAREIEQDVHDRLVSNFDKLLIDANAAAAENSDAFTDEQYALLDSKEALDGIMASSHDFRNTLIDQLEESLVKQNKDASDKFVDDLFVGERMRNRKRVAEVWSWIDRHRHEIRTSLDAYFAEEGDEHDDDDEAGDR